MTIVRRTPARGGVGGVSCCVTRTAGHDWVRGRPIRPEYRARDCNFRDVLRREVPALPPSLATPYALRAAPQAGAQPVCVCCVCVCFCVCVPVCVCVVCVCVCSTYAYVVGSVCGIIAGLDPETTRYQNASDNLNQCGAALCACHAR